MATKFLDYNGLSYFWSKLKSYVATTSHSGLMSATDKAKVDSINTNGTIAYYRKEESVYVTETVNEDTIPIGVSGFTTADMLLVDINGLDLSEGEEYEISGTNIVLDTPIGKVGTVVHFVVLRAVTATVSDYDALKGDKGDNGVVQDVLQNGVSVVGQDGVARLTIVDMFYPVGSYYETSDDTFDPNVSWGGTWELETEGQVHIGAGTTYTIDGALTNTTDGGAKSSSVSFSASNIQSAVAASSALSHHRISTLGTSGNYYIPALTKAFTRATSSTGKSVSHMQPYIIVNRWHRTA